MIEKIQAELTPYAEHFQEAGRDGFHRVQLAPYDDDDQWRYRRLQRDLFLYGLYKSLPSALGSFQVDDGLFGQNRLVYRSEPLGAELVFRRRKSIGAYGSKKKPFAANQEALFPIPIDARAVSRQEFRQIACVWDLPAYNDKHELQGAIPFRVYIAKPNTSLDERDWEDDFFLRTGEDLIPKGLGFNPEEDDWDFEDEQEDGR
ncbi:hypothetical protein [Corynebacterium afermentans]|uniref:hypothetical protein n=1 Tax=Corynebacterium afermentans TaxID=38286 RepID=UPI0025725336|nr:hypothetical protein [Corynebacterium afermentans]MDC7108970.1 hypothetical protein [Corynebacterium afermentans]